MNTISNIPRKIFNFFTQKSEELAIESRFKIRHSKLTPSAFVKALVRSCFAEQFGLELFCDALKEQKITITKQSLFERFNKRTSDFLNSLARLAIKHFETEKLAQLKCLEHFKALNLIDSSTVSLHQSLSKLFKGSGGVASSAALKIQVMYDYLSGQVKDLELTSGCCNDQGFDNFLNAIQKEALYLMDLGYFKLASFKKIIDGEAFFVSRLLTGTKLFNANKEPLDLLTLLSSSGPFVSLQVLLGANAKIPIRLVAQRLPDELADSRRRKLKAGHKRRGIIPSKDSLALQSWSIYITNTTEQQISDKELHLIYSLRWQIELLFKLSKSLMKIDSLKTKKSYRVICEIYGKFIAMMLLFLLCEPARFQQKPGKEISFYKACKLLRNKSQLFICALTSIYRLTSFLNSFNQDLSLFAIKDVKKKIPLIPSTGLSF